MGDLIILMGPTGSGKSSQGELIARDLHGVHLSSGHLLREHPKTAPLMASGNLVPAEQVEEVVGEVIDGIAQSKPIVLDGFPRTQSNVHWIDHELLKHGRTLRRVILLDVKRDTIMERLKLRDRQDDGAEAIKRKWAAYERFTLPVVEHYRAMGLLTVVDGSGTFEEVRDRIEDVMR
ncbi:MAG TPA: nucleoside monophosphate kinase [Candidatus Saccharimonadia bacterium]